MEHSHDTAHGHGHGHGHGHAHGAAHDHDMEPKLDAAFWDARYRDRTAPWDHEPNPHMERVAAELPAGTALDVGCGEGSDAVWLADRGWRVTAMDISDVALARGRAADPAGRVTWLREDLLSWEPPAASFDLVSSHFVHFVTDEREVLFRRLAAAVRPGGTLLVVSHHPSDLDTTAGRWRAPEYFYTADDVEAVLDPAGWDVSMNAACPRGVTDPGGQAITVHDTVLVARRRPSTT